MVIKRNHNYRAIDTETKEWVYGSLVGDDYLVTDKLLGNIIDNPELLGEVDMLC